MSLNGTRPSHAVTEVVACRMCGTTRALPNPRPRMWSFRCKGCNHEIEIPE